jgi:SAM-dependent methyltransferase
MPCQKNRFVIASRGNSAIPLRRAKACPHGDDHSDFWEGLKATGEYATLGINFSALVLSSLDLRNDEAIRRAQAAGLNVFKQSIEEHATIAPGKYDVVCSFQVLEHVPEPRGFVHACVQALRPGGKLIIAVPAEDSFLGVASDAHLNMPPHHALRWTDRALRNLALREGLSIVELWHEPVAPFYEDWHKDTLAHHYFVQLGITKYTLVGRTFTGKVLARLFRTKGVRNFFAAKTAERFPHAKFGHTVVLVASKPAPQ